MAPHERIASDGDRNRPASGDTAEAEKALGKAENYRNQLNARSKDFDDAKRLASTLDDESKETMGKLLRDREGLEVFLDDQETRLNIACDMLGFLRDAETLESWLKSQKVAESSSDASIEICQKLLEETDRKVGQAKTWEAKIETLKKPTMFEEANRDAIKKAAEEEELLKMKEREEAEKLAEKAKQEEQKSAAVQETRNEEVEQEREIVQSQSVPSEVSNVQNGNELPDSVKTNGMSQSEDLNQSISSKHESSISESTKEAHSATLSTPTKLKTGALSRKFVVINGKSAKDRTWKDTWISIHDDKVAFYKDKKSSESNKNPDPAFPQAQVKVIREQHHKRDFVLKVTCKNTELLLDTGDKARMEQWFVSLGGDPENASLWSAITDNAAASPSPSRSSKSKKRSLFGRKNSSAVPSS
ncbi:unnamed protein product [Oikopleura dioica]|uniref:PH domain-containing protein n=1 Tax=Oikopleura dioica TaxID=34765 RepID=E4YYH0_OIKDI|nr:unnamed protein product [Oikopleura dioica]